MRNDWENFTYLHEPSGHHKIRKDRLPIPRNMATLEHLESRLNPMRGKVRDRGFVGRRRVVVCIRCNNIAAAKEEEELRKRNQLNGEPKKKTRRPIATLLNVVRDIIYRDNYDIRKLELRHQAMRHNIKTVFDLGDEHVLIDGQVCVCQKDETLGIVVKREPWSLMGAGRTLNAAVRDYRKMAREVTEIMRHDADHELTDEARYMRDVLLRTYGTPDPDA